MTQPGKPRLDPRVRIGLRIDVKPRWNGATSVAMETVDISVSGVALRSPINLPLKTQVSVSLQLPRTAAQAATEVTCEAVVVSVDEIGRTREQWRVGLYFLDMKGSAQLALRRFIYSALEASTGAQRSGMRRG